MRGRGPCGAGPSGPDGAGAHPPARLPGARRPLGPRQLRWAPGQAKGGCSRPASRAGSASGVGSRTEEGGAPREKAAALPLSFVTARGASEVKFGSFSPRVTNRSRGRPWGFPESSLAVAATRRGWQRGGRFGFAAAEGSPGRRGCAGQKEAAWSPTAPPPAPRARGLSQVAGVARSEVSARRGTGCGSTYGLGIPLVSVHVHELSCSPKGNVERVLPPIPLTKEASRVGELPRGGQ